MYDSDNKQMPYRKVPFIFQGKGTRIVTNRKGDISEAQIHQYSLQKDLSVYPFIEEIQVNRQVIPRIPSLMKDEECAVVFMPQKLELFPSTEIQLNQLLPSSLQKEELSQFRLMRRYEAQNATRTEVVHVPLNQDQNEALLEEMVDLQQALPRDVTLEKGLEIEKSLLALNLIENGFMTPEAMWEEYQKYSIQILESMAFHEELKELDDLSAVKHYYQKVLRGDTDISERIASAVGRSGMFGSHFYEWDDLVKDPYYRLGSKIMVSEEQQKRLDRYLREMRSCRNYTTTGHLQFYNDEFINHLNYGLTYTFLKDYMAHHHIKNSVKSNEVFQTKIYQTAIDIKEKLLGADEITKDLLEPLDRVLSEREIDKDYLLTKKKSDTNLKIMRVYLKSYFHLKGEDVSDMAGEVMSPEVVLSYPDNKVLYEKAKSKNPHLSKKEYLLRIIKGHLIQMIYSRVLGCGSITEFNFLKLKLLEAIQRKNESYILNVIEAIESLMNLLGVNDTESQKMLLKLKQTPLNEQVGQEVITYLKNSFLTENTFMKNHQQRDRINAHIDNLFEEMSQVNEMLFKEERGILKWHEELTLADQQVIDYNILRIIDGIQTGTLSSSPLREVIHIFEQLNQMKEVGAVFQKIKSYLFLKDSGFKNISEDELIEIKNSLIENICTTFFIEPLGEIGQSVADYIHPLNEVKRLEARKKIAHHISEMNRLDQEVSPLVQALWNFLPRRVYQRQAVKKRFPYQFLEVEKRKNVKVVKQGEKILFTPQEEFETIFEVSISKGEASLGENLLQKEKDLNEESGTLLRGESKKAKKINFKLRSFIQKKVKDNILSSS